jgi:cyclopropane fatty-acyl-phospholipid synthase-like methyltransferase
MLLFKMLRRGGGRAMDPLQVSMTGVRMGERFLQIGCDDRALLSGLAAKVGLSGTAAVATLDDASAKRAAAVGVKVGALIDIRPIAGHDLPFDSDQFDMIVIDDTRGAFASLSQEQRAAYLREARRIVRAGGRIEAVEGAITRAAGYDIVGDLESAGFKPVRALAERDGFRFVEGLKANPT